MSQKTLVLFPGAWGNETVKHVEYFFRLVIKFFGTMLGWKVISLTYEGDSYDDHVSGLIRQLRDIPNQGAYMIAYSLGAQFARAVCERRPELFIRGALLGGMERFGVRFFWAVIRAVLAAPIAVLGAYLGRPVKMGSVKHVQDIMMSGHDPDRFACAHEQLTNMHPQKAQPALKIFSPLLRVTLPPFPMPVLAVCPVNDLFMQGVTYPGEDNVEILWIPNADHSFFFENEAPMRPVLEKIHIFLLAA